MGQWDLIGRDSGNETSRDRDKGMGTFPLPLISTGPLLHPQRFPASTLDERKVTTEVAGLGFILGFPDNVSTQLFSSLQTSGPNGLHQASAMEVLMLFFFLVI